MSDKTLTLEDVYLRQGTASERERSRRQQVVEIPHLVGWKKAVIAVDCRKVPSGIAYNLRLVVHARLANGKTQVVTNLVDGWFIVRLFFAEFVPAQAAGATARAIIMIQEHLEKRGCFGHGYRHVEGNVNTTAIPAKFDLIPQPGEEDDEENEVEEKTSRVA